MGFKKIDATEWTCDGCPREITIPTTGDPEDDKTPPSGWLRGTAIHGAVGGEWVAHSQSCVSKAVAKSLEVSD